MLYPSLCKKEKKDLINYGKNINLRYDLFSGPAQASLQVTGVTMHWMSEKRLPLKEEPMTMGHPRFPYLML